MKTKYTISIMVSTAVLLTACGGGGSKVASTPTSSKSNFNITGTVPGTLIEAFCENGSYYSVNSEQNGTTKHPFVLNLPTNLSCRLVMTTNEGDINNKVVTPIKFTNKLGVSSIAFRGMADIDLKHIDLALTRANMSSDINSDGVEDKPTEVILGKAESETVEVIENAHDPMDEDGDDIINVYEDDDNDGVNNRDDDDDDGDGVLDHDDSDNDDDHDGDGIEDDEDEDDDNDGIKDEPETPTVPEAPTDLTPTAGRLLASQCAQCHRTDANPNKGFEDLIGEKIYGELVEMKQKKKLELMHLQAKGYSDKQIRLIDDYFNNLSKKQGGK